MGYSEEETYYPPSQQKIKDREELWQLYLAILPLHPVPDVAMAQAKLFHARWKAETAPESDLRGEQKGPR